MAAYVKFSVAMREGLPGICQVKAGKTSIVKKIDQGLDPKSSFISPNKYYLRGG